MREECVEAIYTIPENLIHDPLNIFSKPMGDINITTIGYDFNRNQ